MTESSINPNAYSCADLGHSGTRPRGNECENPDAHRLVTAADIADMVRGSTFVAAIPMRWRVTEGFYTHERIAVASGTAQRLSNLDPAVMRDVTHPAVTP